MSEKDLFLSIYRNSNKRSEISGKDLRKYENSPYFFNCFAHIIPKRGSTRLARLTPEQKEILLRLNPENIMLVTPEEHYLIDFGTEEQRKKYEEENNCSFDKFFQRKDFLINLINQKLSNYGCNEDVNGRSQCG